MNVKTVLAHAASLLAIYSIAGAAAAQPAATAPSSAAAATGPVTPPLPGPALAGVCYFSLERVRAQSAIGHAVQNRLQQIGNQVNAELQTEGTSLENDIRAFNAARATLDPTAAEQRAAQLQLRQSAFQRKQAVRQREMEFTVQYANIRLTQEAQPVMMQVASQRNCSVLLDDNIVMAANQAMDITPTVITGLNARIQTITFDRIQVNQQTGQPIVPGQPGAAAPAGGASAPR
jgi:outer membrane protein